ncbi:MAG: nucleoside-diphosphate sugar epimerase/dehydratase, partial [Gammaproteobacteria bacterium]
MGTVRIFRHFIRLELFMLMVVEVLILVLTLYAGALLRFAGEFATATETIGSLLPRALVFAVLMELGMAAMGMYAPSQREGLRGTLFRLVVGLMLGAVAMMVSVYIFPHLYLGRGALVLATAVAFIGIGTIRTLGFTSTGNRIFNRIFSRRVLVLGTGNEARSILEMRRRADWRSFELLGFARVEDQDCAIPQDKIVAINKPLVEFATQRQIDVIVVSLDERRNKCPIDQLLECKMIGIDVIDTATFFERQFGQVRLDLLRPSHFIFSDGFQVSSFSEFLKR